MRELHICAVTHKGIMKKVANAEKVLPTGSICINHTLLKEQATSKLHAPPLWPD